MGEYVTIYDADTDVAIAEAPTIAGAVTFRLRADLSEVGTWKELYAKSDEGYEILDCLVTPTGTTVALWQLALDTETPGAYGAVLDLDTVEDGVEKHFYVRAKALDTEVPTNDATVTLVVSGDAAVPEA
jgi:hypothetical protein